MNRQTIRVNGSGSNPLFALGLIFGAQGTSSYVEPKTATRKVITEADAILQREFKLRSKQFVTTLKEVAAA